MLPLKVIHVQRKIPYVSFILVAAVIIVFLVEVLRQDVDMFIFKWSLLPVLFKWDHMYSFGLAVMAIFVNTSVFQVLSGAWFLKVFGDVVEDYLGHVMYLVFFILAGMTGLITQFAFIKKSNIPINGSAGAISAVVVLFLVLNLQARMKVWFPVKNLKQTLTVPAWFYGIAWFLLFFLHDLGTVGKIPYQQLSSGWVAVAGGSAFGLGIGLLLRPFLIKK